MSKPISISTGLPTEPDIARLNAHFGKLEAGMSVSYQEIGNVIQSAHGTNRWSTVTSAWRKKLSEARIYFRAQDGNKFVVRNVEESGIYGADLTRRGMRSVRASARVLNGIEVSKLTPETRARVDRALATQAAFTLAAATQPKALPLIK